MPGALRPSPQGSTESGPVDNPSIFGKWFLVCAFGGAYICTSAALISFNKFLMHENRFPFAVTLVVLHMGMATILSLLLLLVRPSLFPSLTDPINKVGIDKEMVFKTILPIAVLFSVQLVLSNTAYLHSSVAFLQMMKEANLVLVYFLSLIFALEHFRLRSIMILLFICGATSLTIVGELKFSWTGFAMQGTSQFFECGKIVLQSVLLSEAGKKLDVMSYLVLVAPACFGVLCIAGFGLYFVAPDHSFMEAWPHFHAWWPYLILNSLVAFALNVVIALFIKHTSAVPFILAGMVKDVCIVTVGATLFHEHISVLQVFGFSLQMCGILLWSIVKTFPQNFEDGMLNGMMRTFFGYSVKKVEKSSYGSLDSKA
jgi:hypothetical protein